MDNRGADATKEVWEDHEQVMRLHSPALGFGNKDYGIDNLCIGRHYSCRNIDPSVGAVKDILYGWHEKNPAGDPNSIYKTEIIKFAKRCGNQGL